MAKKPASLVGRTVGDGAFTIESFIGRGGMGEVYVGVDADGGRVAIKFLSERLVEDEESRARFRREARVAAEIESPYVAQIVMAGVNYDRPWIAFELLEGESLESRLHREKRIALSALARIGDDVMQGLRAAHSVAVIHRDIKPGNIFLERDRARVMDFGVSKVVSLAHDTTSSGLTGLDVTLGTPAYMSPEQLANARDVDARTDVYAVGVVLFRALAGAMPFAGRTKMELLAFKQNRDALSLRAASAREWPAPLEDFLATTLRRARAERFSTIDATLTAWRHVVRACADFRESGSLPAADEGDTDVAPPSSGRSA